MIDPSLARGSQATPLSTAATPAENLDFFRVQCELGDVRSAQEALQWLAAVDARLWKSEIKRVREVVNMACDLIPRAIVTVRLLIAACHNLATHPSSLTALHANTLRQCLIAKTLHLAERELLTEPLSEVGTDASITDVLEYGYYGGLVLAGLRKYSEAAELFLTTITSPSLGVTCVQVEAYKKYVLVCLLESGNVPTLPRYTSHAVTKAVQAACHLYTNFSETFCTLNAELIQNFLEQHRDQFKSDGCLTLAQQAVETVAKHALRRSAQTHVTAPMGDVELPKVVQWVVEGVIKARLEERPSHEGEGDQKTGTMIHYVDDQTLGNVLDRDLMCRIKAVKKMDDLVKCRIESILATRGGASDSRLASSRAE